MSSLQELHDFYLKTRPNPQKVQRASQLLIRLCKQLNLSSPEEITPDYYAELPQVIDIYYSKDFHKAIQDKSILAEMIGRMGPIEGWDKALDSLLQDKDSNLRQFSLQSLEYCGRDNLSTILPYIEKYQKSDDSLMQMVAARVLSKIYSVRNERLLLKLILKWAKNKNIEFLTELKKRVKNAIDHDAEFTKSEAHELYFIKLCDIIDHAS